jgi:HEPN domain-containing protein
LCIIKPKAGGTLLNPNEKYAYWEDIAEYDLKTAEAMYQSGRYLYVVFMCQQAIEKLVKGLYVFKLNEEPPRTHNILNIFNKIYSQLLTDDKALFYEDLLAFYISERYPSYKDKLSESIDQPQAKSILEKTREEFLWLKSLKK